MASIRSKFEVKPWRSLASLALIVVGVWVLGGWLDMTITNPVVPFAIVIGGAIIASSPLPGQVTTGLLIMILGMFIGLRMAGIAEVAWMRYLISFVLIANGLWFFLSDDYPTARPAI